MPYKHVALIGLGLISSSIALSLRRENSNVRITGTSRSFETRTKAVQLGICEVFESSVEALPHRSAMLQTQSTTRRPHPTVRERPLK